MKNVEELVEFAIQLVATKTGFSLSYIQKVILRECLLENKKTYAVLAEENNYSESYIKFTVAPRLWLLLSQALGEKVNKTNFAILLEQHLKHFATENNQKIAPIPAPMPMAGVSGLRYVLESPEGQVPISSYLYVERSTIEQTCYQKILQPRALIRIKAPRKMGKTSLIARILNYGSSQNYHTVRLSLHYAETQVFEKSDRFLRWFCTNVTQQLGMESKIKDFWDEDIGALTNSTIYFECYLLKELSNPMILALDGVDQLFEYPAVARDFFILLRFWYEETKDNSAWHKLRILMAHAVEAYIPSQIHSSPFNVGFEIVLPTFNQEQVQDLAERHGLQLTKLELEQLMKFTNGFPYLIRLTFYQSIRLKKTVQELLEYASSSTGIYQQHLQYQLWKLQKSPKLLEAFQQVLNNPTKLEMEVEFKLKSLGLIDIIENQSIVSCELYREHFRNYFS